MVVGIGRVQVVGRAAVIVLGVLVLLSGPRVLEGNENVAGTIKVVRSTEEVSSAWSCWGVPSAVDVSPSFDVKTDSIVVEETGAENTCELLEAPTRAVDSESSA